MSPHPSITAPPIHALLPRQTGSPDDPYGISSLYSELSSLYPELYSTYTFSTFDSDYYSSLMEQYSSILATMTFSDYTNTAGLGRPTATGGSTTRLGSSQPTGGVTNGGSESGGGGGLSSGAKIGIGVGVTLAVVLLAGVGIFLWCLGKRKGKQSSTTIVQPAQSNAFPTQPMQQQPPQQQQQQPQMGYMNNQGYIQGFQQPGPTPPPQYVTPHPQQQGAAGAYGAYGKEVHPHTVELEQEYHFAKPGVVEMGDGLPATQPPKPN